MPSGPAEPLPKTAGGWQGAGRYDLVSQMRAGPHPSHLSHGIFQSWAGPQPGARRGEVTGCVHQGPPPPGGKGCVPSWGVVAELIPPWAPERPVVGWPAASGLIPHLAPPQVGRVRWGGRVTRGLQTRAFLQPCVVQNGQGTARTATHPDPGGALRPLPLGHVGTWQVGAGVLWEVMASAWM